MEQCMRIGDLSDSPLVGYTPYQIKKAYHLSNGGEGVSVGILSFYYRETIQSNLDVFSDIFGLPRTKIGFFGESKETSFHFSALLEPDVDAQWFHAIAPLADIKMIAAENYTLEAALDAAMRAYDLGCDIILLTFHTGQNEFLTQYGEIFNKNCVFVCSSGDSGTETNFPAAVPYCIAVGGTTLFLNEDGERIAEETAWSGSGGGNESFFELPPYQRNMAGIYEQTGGKRGVPDVASVADPYTGVSVYHSPCRDVFGWYKIGGTSVAAPITAGILANLISKQPELRRDLSGIGAYLYTLAGKTSYTNDAGKFNDITIGGNGKFFAHPGYDLCTGLGCLMNI